MKKFFILFSTLLLTMFSFAQLQLPLDFESPTLNYTFTDFGGGATTKIANPQVNGINTSANVARMVKGAGEVYGGSLITLASPINFSVNKTFKVKVFSPRVGARLLLKVENATDGSINFEREATSTVANAWEDLTFDYTTISTTNQYSKLVFIFDLGTAGNGTANYTWLFDDVRLIPAGGGGGGLTQMNVPVTFDDATVNYGLVGFGGAEDATVVTDPTLATNKVGRVVKSNTAELWAGASITALAGTVQTSFANAIPFTATERRMNVRVWSPHTGISIKLKVEDKTDPTKSCETDAMFTGAANTWQTLEFNFNNQSAGTAAFNPAFTFNKATIFFNFGVTGAVAGARTYYFDDVKFGPGNVPPAPTVISPVSYCQNASAVPLSATAQAGNSLSWYSVATGGVALAMAPTPSTTTVGSTTFYVSQTNSSGVEGLRASIVVTINSLPAAPTTGSITYCQNSTAVPLTATTGAGNSLRWYTVATGGTASTTAPTPATTTAGNTLYYVSQVNANGCEGPRASLTVTVNALPAAPVVTSPLQICLNATSTSLTATATAGNSLLWYTAATGGTGLINAPTTVTSTAGSTNYFVSQTNSLGCESQRAILVTTIVAPPTAPVITATPSTQLLPGQTVTLAAANAPGAGNTYSWFRNGIMITGQTGNSISVNIDGAGNYNLKIANALGCQSTSNAIIITGASSNKMFVYPNPSTGKFQVRYFTEANNLQPLQMAVYNSAGALIYSAKYTIFGNYTPMDVDLTRHGHGFYHIKLLDVKGKVLSTETIMVHK